METLIDNWWVIAGGLVAILGVVAPITKWKGDDKALSILKRILNMRNPK